MAVIICYMTDCIYNVDKGKKEKAYRFQCGNDEIVIDASAGNMPTCYSFDDEGSGETK